MDQERMTRYVISELGKHKHPNDVIKALCETGQIDWSTAKRFVYTVKAKNKGKIMRRRAPMLIMIALITMVVGAVLTVGISIATLRGWIIFFLAMPIPYLGNIVYFLVGVGAFFGGLIGLFRVTKGSLS
jgi:hypothetical protein